MHCRALAFNTNQWERFVTTTLAATSRSHPKSLTPFDASELPLRSQHSQVRPRSASARKRVELL